MDETTASGMEPAFVASQVVEAVQCHLNDVLLAPVFHRLAVYLKNIFPNLFATLMAKRALKQRQKENK